MLQRQAGCGQGEQGRATTGDQAQHNIVSGQFLSQCLDPSGGIHPGLIRHWMRGLNDLDPLAINGMAIPGDDQPLDPVEQALVLRPCLNRGTHGGGGLASTGDHDPALDPVEVEAVERRADNLVRQAYGKGCLKH